MDRNMFYGAKPKIFEFAKFLRGNMTLAEKLLWNEIKDNKLGHRFKPQHPANSFVLDFYCHKFKLAVEVDGENHKNRTEYDAGRTYELENFGIKIIRFSNEEVINNIGAVIMEITKHLS